MHRRAQEKRHSYLHGRQRPLEKNVLVVVILGYALGILLPPVEMLYKNVSMGLQIALIFQMFFDPVVFTIPESGFLSLVIGYNPLNSVLDITRA